MHESLELGIQRVGDVTRLVSPAVGFFTRALPEGQTLVPGQEAGVITALGRSSVLVVPSGVSGSIASKRRERVHAPVEFGEVLYELEPLAHGARAKVSETVKTHTDGARGPLVLRSPQSGRYYHRPAPGEAAFVAIGDVVEEGRPVGLIEVMKTFTHVVYRATNGLPARARVLRIGASDGGEVRAGDVVLELEPA